MWGGCVRACGGGGWETRWPSLALAFDHATLAACASSVATAMTSFSSALARAVSSLVAFALTMQGHFLSLSLPLPLPLCRPRPPPPSLQRESRILQRSGSFLRDERVHQLTEEEDRLTRCAPLLR